MSSRINLNDNVNECVEFTVGGLDYNLNYPTLDGLKPIQDLMAERETATPERQKEIDQEAELLMYGMIVPVGHTTPIKEVIDKQTLPVRKNFSKMLTDAFTL